MTSFLERFEGALKPVLEAVSGRRGDVDWSLLFREVQARLGEECDRSLPPGFEAGEAELARFPFLAWIDEAVLTCGRPGATAWRRYGLLKSFRGATDGGDLFFQNLESILHRRSASMETIKDAAGRRAAGGLLTDPDRRTGGKDGRTRLSNLPVLWLRPGEGPDKVAEEILDCYAISLRMGFRGRLADPGYAEVRRALVDLARTQIEASRRLRPVISASVVGSKTVAGGSVFVAAGGAAPAASSGNAGEPWSAFGALKRRGRFKSGWVEGGRSTSWKALRRYGWIAAYLLFPAGLTAYVYLKSLTVIESLPF